MSKWMDEQMDEYKGRWVNELTMGEQVTDRWMDRWMVMYLCTGMCVWMDGQVGG